MTVSCHDEQEGEKLTVRSYQCPRIKTRVCVDTKSYMEPGLPRGYVLVYVLVYACAQP